MKTSKKSNAIIGMLTIAGNVMADEYFSDDSAYVDLPRFIQVRKERLIDEQDYREVDLLQVFKQSTPKYVAFIDRNELIERGFQDEKDDMGFIEFDDDTITVPVELFRSQPINIF